MLTGLYVRAALSLLLSLSSRQREGEEGTVRAREELRLSLPSVARSLDTDEHLSMTLGSSSSSCQDHKHDVFTWRHFHECLQALYSRATLASFLWYTRHVPRKIVSTIQPTGTVLCRLQTRYTVYVVSVLVPPYILQTLLSLLLMYYFGQMCVFALPRRV